MSSVRVIKDYVPNAEDAERSRSIKEGQIFNLIDKTNVYWWLVRDGTAANHFFVPSMFVEEIPPESAAGPKKKAPDVALRPDKIEETLKMLDDALDGEDDEDDLSDFQYKSGIQPNSISQSRKSALPRTNLADFESKISLDDASMLDSLVQTSDESVGLRGSGSSSEVLYMNTSLQHEQVHEPPPDYANLSELENSFFDRLPKPVSRAEDVLPTGWEIHVDQSGRPFYMHKVTKKTSWTLPTAIREDIPNQTVNVQQMPEVDRMTTFQSSHDIPIVITTAPSSQDVSLVRAPSAQPSPALADGEVRAAAKMAKPPSLPVLHNLPPMDHKRTSAPNGDSATTNNSHNKAPQLQEIAQNINRTKVMENGKKCRKNWNVVFVHMDGRYLYFYKQALTTKPSQKPEAILDLLNAEIKTGAEVEQMSSKKHVISVKKDGTEYLLNTDNAEDLISWATALLANIKILKSMPSDMLPGESEKVRSLKKRASASAASVDEYNKKKNAETLNEFLPKRKSIKDLKDKNIYKLAPVFGNHLQLLCEREKALVPRFVTKCINAVETKGLAANGIYRVPGNLADIQSLRFMINKDEKYEELATKWDVYVLAGALKLFFRELQEPLFTFALFDAFLRTMEEKDERARAKQEKELLDRLPPANKETTKVLFRHMAKVAAHSAENQMTNRSLAIVFGPTLLWPETSTNLELGTLLVCQGRVVENILTDLAALF